MPLKNTEPVNIPVALLAEGVDRNKHFMGEVEETPWSPSSRRAWIEIRKAISTFATQQVALLAEGVDRNILAVFPLTQNSVALLAEGVDRNIG